MALQFREELRKALSAIGRYLATYQLEPSRTLVRLDGQYGNGVVLSDVAGFAFVTRGKDYHLLDHPLIQARLHLPPDQTQQRLESQMERSLSDSPQIPVGVQPHSAVDNSDVAPTRLTGHCDAPYAKETLPATHFKHRGSVCPFMCTCSCSWSVSCSLW